MSGIGRTQYHLTLVIAVMLCLSVQVCEAQGRWESVGQRPAEATDYVKGIDSATCILTVPHWNSRYPGSLHFITHDAGATWKSLSDSTISIEVRDPELISALEACYFSGKKYLRVVQSSDSGHTWKELTTFPMDALPEGLHNGRFSVHAFAADRAFLFTGGRFVTVHRNDTIPKVKSLPVGADECIRTGKIHWIWSNKGILRSIDDGETWTLLEDKDVATVTVQDSLTAWVWGHNQTLRKTMDGGLSWKDVPLPRIARFWNEMQFHISYLVAPRDTTQSFWMWNYDDTYTKNADGTWDGLKIPVSAEGFATLSRCRDGSSWATEYWSDSSDYHVYRCIGEPEVKQGLTVKDLSSDGVKRANVIVPHIGWNSWTEAIVERADVPGSYREIGRIRSPDFVYTDESCSTAGPYRYRVTLDPPAGAYHQLEAEPIALVRDSVLIIDLIEYLTIPDGMTLIYDNGMSVYCSYDPTEFKYTFHRRYDNGGTGEAYLFIEQHPDLVFRVEKLIHYYQPSIFGDRPGHVDSWEWNPGQRFVTTKLPPDQSRDTLTMTLVYSDQRETSIDVIKLIRHVGILSIKSRSSFLQLDRILSSPELPGIADDLMIRSVFPNPASDNTDIRINVGGMKSVTLHVYDAMGRKVDSILDGNLQPGRHTIRHSTASLPRGLYFLVLRQGESLHSRKLLLW